MGVALDLIGAVVILSFLILGIMYAVKHVEFKD